MIGAGAGLSTAAGFTPARGFETYFCGLCAKYGIRDMYAGGFLPFLRGKNFGRIGAGIFSSTAIKTRQKPVYEGLEKAGGRQGLFVGHHQCGSLFSKGGFDKSGCFTRRGITDCFSAASRAILTPMTRTHHPQDDDSAGICRKKRTGTMALPEGGSGQNDGADGTFAVLPAAESP